MLSADLHTSGAQIRDALDDLQAAWAETTDSWNDGVSRDFCEEHLEPIGPIVKLTLDSMTRMALVVSQMHRDCEE